MRIVNHHLRNTHGTFGALERLILHRYEASVDNIGDWHSNAFTLGSSAQEGRKLQGFDAVLLSALPFGWQFSELHKMVPERILEINQQTGLNLRGIQLGMRSQVLRHDHRRSLSLEIFAKTNTMWFQTA